MMGPEYKRQLVKIAISEERERVKRMVRCPVKNLLGKNSAEVETIRSFQVAA